MRIVEWYCDICTHEMKKEDRVDLTFYYNSEKNNTHEEICSICAGKIADYIKKIKELIQNDNTL